MTVSRIELLVAMIKLMNGQEQWSLHEIWSYLVEKGLKYEKNLIHRNLNYLQNLGVLVETADGQWQVTQVINLNGEVVLSPAEAIQVFVTLSDSLSTAEVSSMPSMNRLAEFLGIEMGNSSALDAPVIGTVYQVKAEVSEEILPMLEKEFELSSSGSTEHGQIGVVLNIKWDDDVVSRFAEYGSELAILEPIWVNDQVRKHLLDCSVSHQAA